MKILSINSAQPTTLEINGKEVLTSIFKTPLTKRTKLDQYGVIGNEQADLVNHGGLDKAIYAFGVNHYHYWQQIIGQTLDYGALGENLSLDQLDETKICIGDTLVCGEVHLIATQFRQPCFKLGAKFNRRELPAEFIQHGYTGVYFKVASTGELGAGDSFTRIAYQGESVSVYDLFCAYFHGDKPAHKDILEAAADLPDLPLEWRNRVKRKLQRS